MNPNSLGDIILLPANAKLATLSGNVGWDKQTKASLPSEVRISAVQNRALWLETAIDSSGNYSVDIPAGKYEIMLPDAYFPSGDKVYASGQDKPLLVSARAGKKTNVPDITIPSSPIPDLIPAKGILHHFTAADTSQVDHFIETYQQYYGIPGVSLALIKDGKMIYHKAYTSDALLEALRKYLVEGSDTP